AIVVAAVCSRNGNSRKTAENTAGISVPPENPWTTRQKISDEKSTLSAQAIDATVKTETAATNSQRMVKVRVKNPVSGMATISAIKYAVCTQLIWSCGISSAR